MHKKLAVESQRTIKSEMMTNNVPAHTEVIIFAASRKYYSETVLVLILISLSFYNELVRIRAVPK